FTAFRVKTTNLPAIRQPVHCYRPEMKYDTSYLTAYFSENHDNPYALWNVLLSMMNGRIADHLTQFPPMFYPKDADAQKEGIERMSEMSHPADAFFTYDRTSMASRLIRKWDRGMWSHVGMVGYEGTLHEVLTSGPLSSDWSHLQVPSLDVGLYRLRQPLSEDQQATMVEGMEGVLSRMKGYGWYKVIRIGLEKKFHIPYRRGTNDATPADLMYGNQFQLVCYA
ncbi:hypothetical protein LCGC14_3134790, partial [marine sediment metagenome]